MFEQHASPANWVSGWSLSRLLTRKLGRFEQRCLHSGAGAGCRFDSQGSLPRLGDKTLTNWQLTGCECECRWVVSLPCFLHMINCAKPCHHSQTVGIGSNKAWANHDPGNICGLLSFSIRPTGLKKNIYINGKQITFFSVL